MRLAKPLRLAAGVVAVSSGLLAGTAAAAHPASSFERPVKATSAGEPVIAVDPQRPGRLLEEDSAGISLSNDYGRTWTTIGAGQIDPAVAIGPHGEFVAHASGGGIVPLDGFWIETSHDAGRTWSAPVQTFAFPQLTRGTLIAWDRPWLTADPTTGTIYASIAVHTEEPGGLQTPPDVAAFLGCHATVFTNAVFNCGRRYISASHDGGRTFGPAEPVDSAAFPDTVTGGFSGIPVAADGVLATFYDAGAAPGNHCPCVIFETSRDDGRHWSRHVVTGAIPRVNNGPLTVLDDKPQRAPYLSPLISDSPSVELGPYDAADAAHPGTFAAMLNDASRKKLLVFETTNSGRTWRGPAVLQSGGGLLERPWLAFAPDGSLGAFWRNDQTTEGSAFDTWAAVSARGNLVAFSAPVRISHAWSPGSANISDDNSFVALDDHYLYATWGDGRDGGQVEPWFGRYRYR